MHQGGRLKYLIEKGVKTKEVIAAEAGIAASSLYNYFNMEEIPIKKLRAILQAAGIDQDMFFDNQVNDPAGEYRLLKEKLRTLEELIKSKDVIIIQQSEMIEILKASNKRKK